MPEGEEGQPLEDRSEVFDEALEAAREEGDLEEGDLEEGREDGRPGPQEADRAPEDTVEDELRRGEPDRRDVRTAVEGVDLVVRLALGAPTPEGVTFDLGDPEDRLDFATRWCMPAARKYSRHVRLAPEIRAGVALAVLLVFAWLDAPSGEDEDEDGEGSAELPDDVEPAGGGDERPAGEERGAVPGTGGVRAVTLGEGE